MRYTLLLLATIALAVSNIIAQQPAPQETDDALFHEFVHRYLTRMDRWGKQSAPEIVLGQLPDLPAELPVPASSRVIGSAVWAESAMVILESTLPSEQVFDFYDSFTATGWTSMDQMMGPRRGGITPQRQANYHSYCLGSKGPLLAVRATDRSGVADVRLSLSWDSRNLRCETWGRPPSREDHIPLPTITSPAETMMLSARSGGGGPDSRSSEAELETELSLEALADTYARQLEDQGWKSQTSETSDSLLATTWTTTNDEGFWQTMLLIVKMPVIENRVFILLRTDLIE